MLAAKYGIIEKSFPWLIKVFIFTVFLDIVNMLLLLKLPIPFLYGILLIFSLSEYKIVKRVYGLHFIPFLSFLVFWIILRITPLEKIDLLKAWNIFDGSFSAVYIVYAVFYLYLAKLYLSEKDIEEKNIIFHIRNQIIFLILISVGNLLKLFHVSVINFNLNALRCATNFFTIVFMAVYFLSIKKKKNDLPFDPPSPKKNIPNLTPAILQQYEKNIEFFFYSSRDYIKPNFTISILSEKTGIPKHHLSFFFNQYLKQNFNEYLAKYRIDYAVKMLSNDSLINMKIETIAFECGYNSATTFNKWFKFFNNCLPNEFIKDLRSIQKNQ